MERPGNGSTGPRTPHGKARAAHNAVAHGLYTAAMVIRHGPLVELEAEAGAFVADVIADLRPVGTVEHELTARVAALLWRLRRATRADAALAAASTVADPDATGEGLASLLTYRLHAAGDSDEADRVALREARPHVYAAAADAGDALQRAEAHVTRELCRTLALLDALQRRRAAPRVLDATPAT